MKKGEPASLQKLPYKTECCIFIILVNNDFWLKNRGEGEK